MTMQVVMTGNEAVARGAFEAGVAVAAGYPGTPSTEILENFARYPDVYAEWSPNEKVALEVGFGASVAGARVLVTMKHVGLNVAADPFMTLSYTGVNGGIVVVTADDPGMHSSQNEQDNRYFARFAKVPLIEPGDSQEAKEFLKEAFLISERFDTPVLFRLTTRVAHTSSPVLLGERERLVLYDFQRDIAKYVMLPVFARARHARVEERREKLESYAEDSPLNQIIWGERNTGIVASGVAFQYAREALSDSASYLKLGMTYPLPVKLIEDFAGKVKRLIVVEELEPFLEDQMRAFGIQVEGKNLFPRTGELSPELIALGVRKTSMFQISFNNPDSLPSRPPIMCPGCPHRGVFYVLSRLKAVVTGDIGCYTLGALPPFEAMDLCLCMGASVGAALGMEKARGREFARKVVAVIGDSTFIHSGITGLIDHVYNRGTGTVIVLDNRTTAMTGHQDHPGTGFTLRREPSPKLDLVELVKGLGVKHVQKVNSYDIPELEKVIREELDREELSVVIADQACALIEKTGRKNMLVSDLCRGCKKCLKLGCPALYFGERTAVIDRNLCRGCGLCMQICPHEAIKAGEEHE